MLAMSTGGLLLFKIYHHFTDRGFSATLALQWKIKAFPSIICSSLILRTNFKSLSMNNRCQVKQISKSELKGNKIQNWLAFWHYLLSKRSSLFSLTFPVKCGKILLNAHASFSFGRDNLYSGVRGMSTSSSIKIFLH